MAFYNHAALNRAANANTDIIRTWEGLRAQEAGPTAFGGIAVDPESRNAQLAALRELSALGTSKGLDEGGRAALMQAQALNNQQLKANTNAAIQRAASEGRVNSGRALSAQIQAQAGAANANAMAGSQAVADSRQRALQALSQTGQLGGQINQQDFSQQAARADATDRMSQFNAQQRQQAQAQRAAGMTQGFQNRYEMNFGRAKDADQLFGNIVGGILSAGASIGGAALSDERAKTDIKPTGKTIDGVPEHEFRYRGDPEGKRYTGVLAQEVAAKRPEDVAVGPDGLLRVLFAKDFPKPAKGKR